VARKRKAAEHENHERWLVSYADFITLLFAFFVVMFASSNQDKAKAQAVSQSVREAMEGNHVMAKVAAVLGGTVNEVGQGNAQRKGPGGAQKADKESPPPDPTVAELIPSMEFLSRELDAEIRTGKLKLSLEPRGLVVSLPQATYFPSGEDTVAPETFASIGKMAGVVRKLPNSVRVEGHTDSIPIHTARFRSNWELSAARSIAVVELLAAHFDIPQERLAIAGYGEYAPIDSNQTAEGRARNRRVDLVILSRTGLLREPPAAAPPATAKSTPHAKK
jgi:chemotaxis protein MotB